MRTPLQKSTSGKEPPYLPVTFFLRNFSRPYRIAFYVGLIIIGILAVALGGLLWNPFILTPSLQVLPTYVQRDLPLLALQDIYQPFVLPFPVYESWTSFFAGPMLIQAFPVILYVGMQSIGWAFGLSAATFMRSRWSMGIFFLFLVYLFNSGAYKYFFPDFDFPLYELAWTLPLLVFFYLFFMNTLKWSFFMRGAIFFLIQVGFYGTLFYIGNWQAWYFTAINQFYFLGLISLLYVFFISKEAVNLILWVGNNRPNPVSRWSRRGLQLAWVICVGVLGLVLFELLTPQKSNTLLMGIPIGLLGVFSLMNSISSQNLFRSVRHIFTSHSVFVFLLLSWGIITLSYLVLHASAGDVLVLRAYAVLFMCFVVGLTLAYGIYIESNFPDRGAKVPIFFLLGKGRRFPYYLIYLMALVVFIIIQGQDRWKTFRMLVHSHLVLEGDASILANQQEQALESYQLATYQLPVSPKANYNLGALLMLDSEKAGLAVEYFRKPLDFYYLPYARLNAAQLLADLQLYKSAVAMLEEGIATGAPLAGVMNHNLGMLALQQRDTAEAISYFKRAAGTGINKDLSSTQLGLLYEYTGSEDFSKWTISLSNSHSKVSELAQINGLALQLRDSTLGDMSLSREIFNPKLAVNFLMRELASGNVPNALTQARNLDAQFGIEESALVLGYLLLEGDSLQEGQSKLEYLAQQVPRFAGRGNYFLGVSMWEKGLFELAQQYFDKAHQAGWPQANVWAFQAGTLAGNSLVLPDSLGELLEREQELMRYAQQIRAEDKPGSSLTSHERARSVRYAMLSGNTDGVVGLLQKGEAADETQEPLLSWLAQNYSLRHPTEALKVLEALPGTREEDLALVNLRAGNYEKASELAQSGNLTASGDSLVAAEFLLHEGDTALALGYLKEVWKRTPYTYETGLRLVDMLIHTDSLFQANTYLNALLIYHPKDQGLWQRYAQIAQQWGMEAEYEYALQVLKSFED